MALPFLSLRRWSRTMGLPLLQGNNFSSQGSFLLAISYS
jgi:hypothetical protein